MREPEGRDRQGRAAAALPSSPRVQEAWVPQDPSEARPREKVSKTPNKGKLVCCHYKDLLTCGHSPLRDSAISSSCHVSPGETRESIK